MTESVKVTEFIVNLLFKSDCAELMLKNSALLRKRQLQ